MKADGGRPRHQARLGRGRSPQHRPSAHPYPACAASPTTARSSTSPATTSPMASASGRARSSRWSWAGRPSRRSARKLEREVDAERFTRLDRMLIAEQAASHGFADLRPDRDMLETARRNRALLIARATQAGAHGAGDRGGGRPLVHLRTRPSRPCASWASAATSSRPCTGRWPTTASPTSAAPRQYVAHGKQITEPIVGRVLAKGLAGDEMGDRLHLVIDGVDGRTHYVETADAGQPGRDQARPYRRARSRRRPRPSRGRRMSTSRSWRRPMAASTGRACIWKRRGTSSSSATATRTPSSAPMCAGWKPCAAPGMSSASTPTIGKSPRTSPSAAWPMTPRADPRISRIRTLSTLDLDRQVGSDGATWLDRELVAKDHLPLAEDRLRPGGERRARPARRAAGGDGPCHA